MTNIFDYPFSNKEIFTKRKSLKKNLLESAPVSHAQKKLKIAILGGSTTSDVVQVLELFLLNTGIVAEFYESDFDRYSEEVLFSSGKFWDFEADIVYIHTTVRNLNFSSSVEKTYNSFEKIWETLKKHSKTIIIQNNFEQPEVRTLGNIEGIHESGRIQFVNKLNSQFVEYSKKTNGFYINDINFLSSFLGTKQWFDATYWNNFKFPYNSEATVYVAHSAHNLIKSIYGKSKKCLVLDLDNTVWGGVIGDDGVEGIKLGEGDPIGEAYLNFQKYVKSLKDRGIVLAVCSKNDPVLAAKGFSHPDSVLKMDDFSSFFANWDTKSENLKKIATELNIGLDSLVFVDDNPAERELVRKEIPSVAVPEVGTDVSEYSRHIDMNGYFETIKILAEDLAKDKFYKDNITRLESVAEFKDYGEFLVSLQMTAEIKPFSMQYLDRLSQLINKTNQFNLTTFRMDVQQVEELIDNPKVISLYSRLTDKFGDNGLVSLILGNIKGTVIEIDVWVMSCRVFKRDLEFAVFDAFVSECLNRNVHKIIGTYKRTEKNGIVAEIYSDLGFKKVCDGEWVLENLKNYQPKNKVIKVAH